MTTRVSDTGKRNTHHLKLTKGTDILGLNLCGADGSLNEYMIQRDPVPGTVLKVMSGEEEYGDQVPPFRDVSQKDWSGGRGVKAFDDDPTRYFDDHRMNATQAGELTLWGMESWGKGIRNRAVVGKGWYGFGTVDDDNCGNIYTGGILDYNGAGGVTGSEKYKAQAITPAANITARYIYFYVRKIGTPGNITVTLHSDNTDKPGTVLQTATLTMTDLAYPYCWYLVRVTITAQALTGSTKYWVSWTAGSSTAGNYSELLMSGASNEASSKACTDGSSWDISESPIYVCITEEDAPARMHQATLKGMDYIGIEYLDGTVSKVYKNGTGGKATSATSTTLVDTNNGDLATNDRFNLCVCKIVAGKGSDAVQPWRKITDCDGTAKSVTVSPAWEITPDSTSEYVILGSNEWIEVTGHGLGAGEQIKCALAVNGAIYFGCGDSVDIVRLRRYWASSTYDQWADDTGNKATMLKAISQNGNMQIYKATRSRPSQVARADTTGLDCTGTGTVAALTFDTTFNVGNLDERINGLAVAGDSYPTLYVLKEGSIYKIENDIPTELRVSEFQTVHDTINGYASLVKGSYLYFNHGEGVERYYKNTVESVGPNLDEGFPTDRTGYVCQMINYKGMLVMLVDGGADNYSSIVVYNGVGYCEMWRSPAKGMRILNGWVQPMPGNLVDRLWINCQGNVLWLPIHGNLAKVNAETLQSEIYFYQVNFAPGGYLISGWMYFSLRLLEKLFHKIQQIFETNYGKVTVLYQTDASSPATLLYPTLDTYFDSSAISSTDVTGRRIRLLVFPEAGFNYATPKILAMVVEAVAVGPERYHDTFNVRVADSDKQLDGTTPDDIKTAAAKLALLRTWIESAGTVTVNCYDPELDGKRLKLDRMSFRILSHTKDELKNKYIVQFSGYEVE